VLVLVAVLALAGSRMLDAASPIVYYRVIDPQTLVVATSEGRGAWTRVTSITETPTTVTITVSSFWFRLGPATDEAYAVESTAKLHEPLGSRTVIDGSSGLPVQQGPPRTSLELGARPKPMQV
jgi:hypothetical protein